MRVTQPAIHDIAISGPFHCLEAVIPNFLLRLCESTSGIEAFEETTETAHLLNQVEYIIALLDSDPSTTIIVELLRMKNAEMMARLPCPVYNVICAKLYLGEAGQSRAGMEGCMAVEEMEIMGCFASLESARVFARQVLEEKAGE